jgi:site-specific recombinase XerD
MTRCVLDGGLAAYLAELRVAGRSPATLRVRGIQLRGWLAWLAGQGLNPGTATRDDAVQFLGMFDNPETRHSYAAALRVYHAWLVDTGRRDDDPTARLPTVRRPPGMPHPVPDSVVVAALGRADPRRRAMLLLGRFAGLRVAEIAAAHHDYLRGGPGREVVRLRGKGGRVREVPAHPLLLPILARPGWVFPSQRGEHLQAGTVGGMLGELLAPWTGHSLRHAFATEAYSRTHDLRLVQTWLGHADPKTTMLYTGVEQNWAAIRELRLVS